MSDKEKALINQILLTEEQLRELRAQANAQSLLLTAIYRVLPDDYKKAINDAIITSFSAPAPTATQEIRASIQEKLYELCPELKKRMLNS